jgi:hypothetical protein
MFGSNTQPSSGETKSLFDLKPTLKDTATVNQTTESDKNELKQFVVPLSKITEEIAEEKEAETS